LLLKNVAMRLEMDSLVIDDDAVEVEEDRLNHRLRVRILFLASPFGRGSKTRVDQEALVAFAAGPFNSPIFSFCSANSSGSRSLSSTSKRRSTSFSASSFFRFT